MNPCRWAEFNLVRELAHMQDGSLVKQFSPSKPCYYCGAPAPSSREHAPVKIMFEAFDCDSITVPSCEKHNTARSLDDRAIVTFFLRGLSHSLKSGSLTPNQLKALEMAEHKLGEAREITLQPLVRDHFGMVDTPLSHIDETAKAWNWMRQLTGALTWSVLGDYEPSINWDTAIVWSPEYVVDTGLLDIQQAGLRLDRLGSIKAEVDRIAVHWWPGWSSYPRRYPPDIYRFDVSLVPSQYLLRNSSKFELIFRHCFYGQFRWYVWFTASKVIKTVISSALRRVSSESST
jgi:hypothetical protein